MEIEIAPAETGDLDQLADLLANCSRWKVISVRLAKNSCAACA